MCSEKSSALSLLLRLDSAIARKPLTPEKVEHQGEALAENQESPVQGRGVVQPEAREAAPALAARQLDSVAAPEPRVASVAGFPGRVAAAGWESRDAREFLARVALRLRR
jgi:hypothetical protein